MQFAEIVRSSPAVRNAFKGIFLHAAWWNLILALHGKPVDVDRRSTQAKIVLARGFRFYGHLYIVLAGIMMLLAVPLLLFAGTPNANFWGCGLATSSFYLCATCQLAFIGARRYPSENQSASLILVTFFVSIIAYLSCFCGVCVAAAHFVIPGYDLLVLLTSALLMAVGAGSYFLEILFLLTHLEAK